jgi:DNA-directed RNA polymerase specialized sigma24 family protein
MDMRFMQIRFAIPIGPPGLTVFPVLDVMWTRFWEGARGVTSTARWSLTRKALDRLLERLGPDREAAGREYHSLRERLLDYFDCKGVQRPDSAADETLDRVARRLDEGEPVERVLPYAYGVARLVLLERLRSQLREQRASAGAAQEWLVPPDTAEEARIACLVRSLDGLPPDDRSLIIAYYAEAGGVHREGRKLLAQRLGIRYEALKTRAHRLRRRLEASLLDALDARRRDE